jgi:hypothetical protein
VPIVKLVTRRTAMSEIEVPEGAALVPEALEAYDELIGCTGEHAVVAGDEVYEQPYVYLSFHMVQMRAAGWSDVDFDTVAAVSGASALFGFEPDEWMPKYAHLHVDPDRRIAEATGFGYEWVEFEGADAAWELAVESVDAGLPVKGHDWENVIFAGYQEAALPQDRLVFGIADGPDQYAQWRTWSQFNEWVDRVTKWGMPRLGRHAGRIEPQPPQEVARRVLDDLVAWDANPPDVVRRGYPDATFGSAGIAALADYLETRGPDGDWVACHPINPQWTIRNSTSVYLSRLVEGAVFPDDVSEHLSAAATQYRAAYDCWQATYAIFGHGTTEAARKIRQRRLAAGALVRAWLAHEKAALSEIEQALGKASR